jgi:translocation and assembly module TamB
MPQERQLSWLVLGRAIDDGGGGSATERELVANAALGLGLAGGEWLAQRLGGRIGFDEISLGAKPGESSDQARLTVGKYLSPKLFISYGVGLFQPGSSFRLQYDIGRGFKLATETGVESGGDLLYTIER